MNAADNPFFAKSTLPYELPPFDKIRNEHYRPAFDKGMADHQVEIQAIANNPQAATFENTIVAMERSAALLNRVNVTFSALTGAHTNDELQKIDVEVSPKLQAHNDSIYLNPKLYARVKSLYDGRAGLGLDAESARLLEKYHTDFVRAGAQLDESAKTRVKAINEELASLNTKFTQNLLEDTNASAVVVDTREELDGLADDQIAALAEAAKARKLDGKYVIQIILPTPQPALAQLKNRALRERLYRAAIERGNRGNEHDNKATLARIVQLRAEKAQLMGYPNHAAYVLEVETARTPAAVNKLLGQVTPAAVANAKREAADMQKLIKSQGGKFKLEPWDWAFYAEQVRKARYDFDETQMKPYLELNRVLQDGVFFMAKKVYGLDFKERKDLPVYEPTVRTFEVFNEDGSALGLFLFDPYARESKRGGAWMNAYVSQNGLLGDRSVVANHLNIPQPPAGQPTLLTFDEANTMFHEFGHALHGLFSNVKYPYFTGTAVPRDFVEYPSQVHEMWVTWPEILANYARHYQTGEPMPRALVDKIKASEQFNQGFTTTEYLAASLLDQAWHQLPADKADVKDVIAFETAALVKAGAKVDEVTSRYRSTYFNHIFGGGYSAGYYSYIWSEVLDADTVEWFKEKGGLSRANGDEFRAKLLSKGGSVDAIELFKGFRGREPDIKPLLDRRGLDAKPVKARRKQ
ncbi:MAG TPA: M3 family metallopeptidase [Verrucomicrobiae bacterium]|nr:M3 family metallopeptidase [Verrucomicrobiae bacterium]